MRLLASLLVLATLSGCVDVAADEIFAPEQDCSQTGAFDQQGAVLLLADGDVPAAATDAVGVARFTVNIRAGQAILAVAVWNAEAGDLRVAFDGPTTNLDTTPNTWTATGLADETRDYTLELRGAPVAAGVSYSLSLLGFGCTPVS